MKTDPQSTDYILEQVWKRWWYADIETKFIRILHILSKLTVFNCFADRGLLGIMSHGGTRMWPLLRRQRHERRRRWAMR